MALTLDPTLQTVQDGFERKPIIELISTQIDNAIPFEGQYFNTYTDNETGQDIINTTTGQIFTSSIRTNGNYRDLILNYTDTGRIFFTEVNIQTSPSNKLYLETCLFEIANGNIVILYTYLYSSKYYIDEIIVDKTGVIVSAASNIFTSDTDAVLYRPCVKYLSNDTYMLTFTYLLAGEYTIKVFTTDESLVWVEGSAVDIGTLDNTHVLKNVSFGQDLNDNILLFLEYADDSREDGTTLNNIYLIQSTDLGVSWETPEKITSYTAFGTDAEYPDVSIISDTTLKLTYHEKDNVLFANNETPLWPSTGTNYLGTDIHFDPSTNRLYVYEIYGGSGFKGLRGVVVIDTINWSVTDSYTLTSTPAYENIFYSQHVWPHRAKGQGQYVTVSTTQSVDYCATMLLDNLNKTITTFIFKDAVAYGLTENVTGMDWGTDFLKDNAKIYYTFVDVSNNRLYVVLGVSYIWSPVVWVGYFKINEGYDFTVIRKFVSSDSVQLTDTDIVGLNTVFYMADREEICLCFAHNNVSSWQGRMVVIDLDGKTVKNYTYANNKTFHYNGIYSPVYYNGHVYGSIYYKSTYGEENKRGLIDIDLETDNILYHTPTWATLNDYNLGLKVSTGDGRILMAVFSYGVGSYDILNDTWSIYNNDNIPGLEPLSVFYPVSIDYDPATETIFLGSIKDIYNAYAGVRAFSINGSFDKGKIVIGSYDEINGWTFGAASSLIQNNYDYNINITNDDDNVLWAVWTRRDTSEYSNIYAKDVKELELTSYILRGSEINIKYDIDSNNTLSFSLSHGHLFDPNNYLSTYNIFVAKGRQINLKVGENINGVDYLQTHGSFLVTSSKMTYERGAYPIIQVSCEDVKALWEDVKVVATQRYNDTAPEDVIYDVLNTFLGTDLEDIDLPTIDNTHDISMQWLDTDIKEICSSILHHFGYIPFITTDNIFSAKKIITSLTSEDRTLLKKEIISYTPNDDYSSFTNKIIINSESFEYIDVVYYQELLSTVTGTGGWWSDKDKIKKVYYSDDRTKRARNPKLVVKKSISDFKIMFVKSRGTEYLSYVDPNEKYVEITIEFPGLADVMFAHIVALGYFSVKMLGCDASNSCGSAMWGYNLALVEIFYVLGMVASYEYELWANPLGEEKKTLYAEANDYEFQRKLNGQVVSESIDDPLCINIENCQNVADYEMSLVKAQRKRISLKKIAHLQDEIGDVLKIVHPYNDQYMSIFVATLNRTIQLPDASGDGSVIDDITGWIL